MNNLGDALSCPSGRVAFGAGLRGVLRHFTDANTGIAIWWQDLYTPEKGPFFKGKKVVFQPSKFQVLC